MSIFLKYLFTFLLMLLIMSVTIVPKVLSYIWYGKWCINEDLEGYVIEVLDVVFTIIKIEE